MIKALRARSLAESESAGISGPARAHYDAWPHKVSLGVEYQHTFKAINQRNGERNNAFLTIGVHW
ncbi:NfrA family protein [Escherichia coli]